MGGSTKTGPDHIFRVFTPRWLHQCNTTAQHNKNMPAQQHTNATQQKRVSKATFQHVNTVKTCNTTTQDNNKVNNKEMCQQCHKYSRQCGNFSQIGRQRGNTGFGEKNSVHLFSFIIRCLKSLYEHGNHLSAADDSLKQTFCKRPATSTFKEVISQE